MSESGKTFFKMHRGTTYITANAIQRCDDESSLILDECTFTYEIDATLNELPSEYQPANMGKVWRLQEKCG